MRATLLLVDDEPIIRQLMARALRSEGHCVLEARNGTEAEAVYGQHGASIDLLVTDVRMPFRSGTDLVARLRRRRRALEVLYVTGFPDDRIAREHRLVKPFTRDALLSVVQQILSHTAAGPSAEERQSIGSGPGSSSESVLTAPGGPLAAP